MKKYIITAFMVIILITITWSARRQFMQGTSFATPGDDPRMRACARLLTINDFRNVCPKSAGRPQLRVYAEVVPFEQLYKCSVSISARNAATFYINVDVFENTTMAGRRMGERIHDGTTEAYGNLLGLSEASALNTVRNGRNLLLWRDYGYAEISPTGGGFCEGSELYELGRLVYKRITELYPQGSSQ